MRMLLIIPMLMLFALPALAEDSESEPAATLPSIKLPPELDRVLRDYEKAWRARDAAALAALFTEDGFVLSSGRSPVRGRAAIRKEYENSGGPLSLRAFAYSTSGYLGNIIGGYGESKDAPDHGKFILTLKRGTDKVWRIAADIDNANQRSRPPE